MDAAARLILADRGIAYAVTDRELNLIAAGGAVEVLGGERATRRGRSLLDLVPELVSIEVALVDLLGGRLPRVDLSWVRRRGRSEPASYFSTATFPHNDGEGRITGVIHVMQDVTDVGAMVHRLTATEDDLQRLIDVQSQLASIAAHELAKPLTPIRGYVEMLIGGDFGPLTEEQCERLELVESSLDRLQRLTGDLCDVLRFEADGIAPDRGPADLAGVVRGLVVDLQPRFQEKSQSVEVFTPPALPFARVDEASASRVVGNLLRNAHLYTPPGGHIDITVALAESEGHIQISVADDGVGIGASDREKLFTRFFRGESATQARVSGTGLGLYIARCLVEVRGGKIWCDSDPGQGSIFHVTFPIADVSA